MALLAQALAGRWAGIAGGLLTEAVSGSSYAIGTYAVALQAKLGFTEDQFSAVESFGNLGLYTSLFAGFVFDRFGPRVTSLGGVLLSLAGYMMFWLSAAGTVPTSPAAMSFYCFVWSHGSAWQDTSVVSSNVRNFAAEKGTAVSLLKSLFGLSASIVTLLYGSLAGSDPASLLRILTFVVPVTAMAGVATQRLIPAAQAKRHMNAGEKRKLLAGALIVGGLAVYLTLVNVLSSAQVHAFSLQPAFAMALLPAAVAIVGLAWPTAEEREEAAAAAEAEDLLAAKGAAAGSIQEAHDGHQQQHAAAKPASGATFLEALLSLDMLIFFTVLFFGTGTGLTTINKIGTVAQSLGTANKGVYVALLSLTNCLGRLAAGACSDAFRHRLSRPGWVAAATLWMAGASAVTAFSDLSTLYVAVLLTGFSYGAYWSLVPAFAADRWGTRAYGAVYSICTLSTAAASFALSSALTDAFYDAHAVDGNCTGSVCFRGAFLVLSACCAVSALLGAWLMVRTRPMYDAVTGEPLPYDDFIAAGHGRPSALARALSCRRGGAAAYGDLEEDVGAPAKGSGDGSEIEATLLAHS